MGPVRRISKEVQYDPVLKENWTLLRLRQEVSRLKLKVPKNGKRLTLVRILKSAEDSSRSDNIAETADNISDIADEATAIYGGARSHDASIRIQEEHVVSTSTPSNEGRTLINLVSRLSSTEEVAVSTFTSTGSHRGEDVNNSGNSHNLESAYASLNRNTIPAAAAGSENQEARSVRTARGYSAETLPFMETISPQQRKNIISGLDINLASVLIPYYVGSGTNEMFDGDDKNYKTDPRLTRALSIGEFIQAFSIYKSVMCSAFPHRRSELDSYERDIVDMANATQCAFNLAFFGFLRCGEFTYSSKIARQDTLLIQNINLDINFQNFTLHLNSSKCDPFREGINITIFENDIFNPVDLMKRYIQIRKNSGARPDSYLFVSDEYNTAPLSRDTFIYLLRDLLFRLGYNDSKFCGHSFRIGAATSAAAAGVEDHIIQTLGRWSSDCYMLHSN
ncbi:unnamed protein product [Mytilus coruscus]|uniref:Tyr recombinase domain-containing protein n=1 Tax=Mytilus coruscus TaxID=42192 RepID=A0A6J8EKE5_MYTCO|nr:unnamed protein product [Mytilus coruscus]